MKEKEEKTYLSPICSENIMKLLYAITELQLPFPTYTNFNFDMSKITTKLIENLKMTS